MQKFLKGAGVHLTSFDPFDVDDKRRRREFLGESRAMPTGIFFPI